MIKILNFSVKTRKYTHSIINDLVPVTLARNQASSSCCTCHYLPEEKKQHKNNIEQGNTLKKNKYILARCKNAQDVFFGYWYE